MITSNYKLIVIIALLVLLFEGSIYAVEADPTLYYFWGEGCSACAKAEQFNQELTKLYPGMKIEKYEVWEKVENRSVYLDFIARYETGTRGVPAYFWEDKYWLGIAPAVQKDIERTISLEYGNEDQIKNSNTIEKAVNLDESEIDLPLIGSINLSNMPLVPVTVTIGLMDGFNPCSLWILMVLLGVVVHARSRKKLMLISITFIIVTASIYGLFMLGVFNVFYLLDHLDWVRILVAAVALMFALINIKDYFFFKKGLSLSIPDRFKPSIYKNLRKVLYTDKPYAYMGVTAVMAAGISLIELPCTAGFPVIWSNILAGHNVNVVSFTSLLILYLFTYLLVELVIITVVGIKLQTVKITERTGRVLKLLSGNIMLVLAITLFFELDYLYDFKNLILIFGALFTFTFLTVKLTKIFTNPKEAH